MQKNHAGKWYAVRLGRVPGIYKTWDEAKVQVTNFAGARYKKFDTEHEAQRFVQNIQESDDQGGAHNDENINKEYTQDELTIVDTTIGKPTIAKPPGVDVMVFTDGSCHSGKAGWGLCYDADENDSRNTQGIILRPPHTNQRGELYAILMALERHQLFAPPHATLLICSDSMYSIHCCRKWMTGWIRNGWMKSDDTPVLNTDILKPIARLLYGGHVRDTLLQEQPHALKHRVMWTWVRGHSGVKGNEVADALAFQAVKDEVQRCAGEVNK